MPPSPPPPPPMLHVTAIKLSTAGAFQLVALGLCLPWLAIFMIWGESALQSMSSSTVVTTTTTTTIETTPAPAPALTFPVWEPPSLHQPIIRSESNDYEWVFPGGGNATAYTSRRYVANEFTPCRSRRELCCAVGSTATGGGQVFNGCNMSSMDLMAEFRPVPARPLFSLVDALMGWHEQHPARQKFTLLFIGDSVLGQMFVAAACELARNAQAQSLTFDSLDYPPGINDSHWRTSLAFQESHVKLHSVPGVDFTLVFVRQYRLTENVKALPLLFMASADVIYFGWGLHYVKQRWRFPAALDNAFGELKKQQTHPKTLIWLGSLKQHFRYSFNDTQVDGLHQYGTLPVRFCGPVARFPKGHVAIKDSVNDYVFEYLKGKLNVSVSWFKWNEKPPSGEQLHVHFLPFEDMTSWQYRNHKDYRANKSENVEDCTHQCSAPNLNEWLWDATALLLQNSRPSNSPRYPAGTQQHPNIVPHWNRTLLDYQMIVEGMQGETV